MHLIPTARLLEILQPSSIGMFMKPLPQQQLYRHHGSYGRKETRPDSGQVP